MGPGRFELPTSPLSGARSNQLSYEPTGERGVYLGSDGRRYNVHKMRVQVAVSLCALGGTVSACIWDSDTLAAEAKGLPGVIEVILGRVDRNPPLYYEMRLERVSAVLSTDPRNLEAYDDAAVACDRLGKSDEAIDWMRKKKATLDLMPDSPSKSEHLYRYFANLGTFEVHRWFGDPANYDDVTLLESGIKNLKEAVDINPDAHFGRERVQILLLEMFLADRNGTTDEMRMRWHLELRDDADRLVEGLVGLMALGSAWESIDVISLLGNALQDQGNGVLSFFALLRVEELQSSGRKSIFSDVRSIGVGGSTIRDNRQGSLKKSFRDLRDRIDEVNRYRESFMLKRLESGRHPDTDPSFWNGYEPPELPDLSIYNDPERFLHDGMSATVGGVIIFVAVVMTFALLLIGIRKRRMAAKSL